MASRLLDRSGLEKFGRSNQWGSGDGAWLVAKRILVVLVSAESWMRWVLRKAAWRAAHVRRDVVGILDLFVFLFAHVDALDRLVGR